ncbi:MAG: type III-A CRISPR-associated protein Csm2 [Haliscomenobacter sp.]|uniref:type III-A CRISPR-associated protein Csm2 n=1 Tax=Haliscomenobacter sp. TaxID=2717303 RepID=UPI0029A60EC3|nr:type III-A CRISPR-associated protein Csm2 [Haliscomenobacter sp.]MDX2070752.1 type III-A CRISPR-associated protein Csm2 [Haliscomenobacter sp.]
MEEIIIKNKKGDQVTLDMLAPQDIDRIAKDFAERFVRQDRLKTHQLRNVFSAIEKMRSVYKSSKDYSSIESDLILLKPKIAYAAGRQRSVKTNFFPLIEQAINAIDAIKEADIENKRKAVVNFFALMESVVGYHKFFESN